jgi:hypothetical protein
MVRLGSPARAQGSSVITSTPKPLTARARRGRRCRDEDNLEENERIKKELNPMKIDEPNTPFHLSPMQTDDDSELGQ